jgi:hypothetical protein
MSPKLLHSCKINLDAMVVGTPLTLELDIGGRKLIYGRGVRARIEVPTEQLDVELKGLTAEVVAALKWPKDADDKSHFVTVGNDHTLVVWSHEGVELRRMEQHQTQVLGVWVFADGCIASCSLELVWVVLEAMTLFVWDARNGGKPKRIAARAGFGAPEHTPPRNNAVEQVVLPAHRGLDDEKAARPILVAVRAADGSAKARSRSLCHGRRVRDEAALQRRQAALAVAEILAGGRLL